MRAMEVMQNMGCDMRVLQMEGAKDPDEFVVKYGGTTYFVEKAENLLLTLEQVQ